MSAARHWEQDKEATVYVGNLDERVSDALVWELLMQAGPVINVHLPKDRVTQNHQGFGFVEFNSEEDAEYAAKVMNQVRIFDKPIRVNKASADKQKTVDVGAELFIGNLDPTVSEQMLLDTFSRFGAVAYQPKIARDENNLSKGYGFVSFLSFDASDDAIHNMNGQYLMNREVSVQYAYKKDGKGERHGDIAERLLAAQAAKNNVSLGTSAPSQGLRGPPPAHESYLNLPPPAGTPGPTSNGRFMPNGGYPGGTPPNMGPRPQAASPLQALPPGFSAHVPPPAPGGYHGPPPGMTPPPAYGAPPPGIPNGAPGRHGPPPPGLQPPGLPLQQPHGPPPPGLGLPPPGIPPGFTNNSSPRR